MPETPPADPATPPDGATPPSDPPPADPPADPAADALGDAGKKALDAMKAERNAAREAAKKVTDELAALKAAAEGREAEHKAQLEAQRVKDEALAAANERILKAEIRTAAKGKLNNPADALRYPEVVDISTFEVGADGEYDAEQIAKAIDHLIETHPYLGAAQGGQRFQGSADGGARNGSQTSIDDQIADATKAGNLQLAIALKQQRSAELAAKKS